VTGREKQGESAPSSPGESEVPTLGNLPPGIVQSLETRLAGVEADLKEVLKLLKEKKR